MNSDLLTRSFSSSIRQEPACLHQAERASVMENMECVRLRVTRGNTENVAQRPGCKLGCRVWYHLSPMQGLCLSLAVAKLAAI